MDVIDRTTPARPIVPTSQQVPIRLVVWAQQPADVERATDHALEGWGRRTWVLAIVERSTDKTCPIDVGNPDAIAAYRQGSWAYAAFRADR